MKSINGGKFRPFAVTETPDYRDEFEFTIEEYDEELSTWVTRKELEELRDHINALLAMVKER